VLAENIYNALRDIVGPDNITQEPAILDTYAFQWCNEVENAQKGKEATRFGQRPAAVVLPGSTDEVQAIVRLCNEHRIKFKAYSTGFGAWAGVTVPGAIQIDLRRMNRIVEINSPNKYAVIEPYVTNAQLQAELIKQGLMHHAQGAGPQTSPLASHTSMVGPGFTSAYSGFSGRNLLGVEWVTPAGEVLRLGSFDYAGAWFSGDGPGPSLRGVMRGLMGAYGGLGVFTKCAIKLYSWPAPVGWKWEMQGAIPDYEWNLPPYWRMHVLNFPDWDTFEKAFYEVNDADISMMAMASSQEGLATMFTNTKEEAVQSIMGGLLTKAQRYFVILVAAHTEREFNYRRKLIQAILKKYGGEDLVETGVVAPKSMHYAEGIRNMLGSHAFRFTSCFQSTHGGMDTIAMSVNIGKINKPIKQKYIEKKLIGDDRGEGMWITGYEGGHMAHMEIPTVYDPADPESCKGYANYQDECNEADIKHSLGIPFFIVGDKIHDRFGPSTNNYQQWLRRIKAAFDPNGVSDSGHYVSAK
jgi:glycolate oxidase